MSLLLLIVALLVVMIASLNYNENIYDFLPMSKQEQKAITLYQDISGGLRIVVMFQAEDNDAPEPEQLTEAVDTFEQKILHSEGQRHVKELVTQLDFEKIAGISQFLYRNMPLMLNDSDYVRMEKLLANPGFVNEQLAQDAEMLLMPTSGLFATNITNDPLSLFSPVMERLQQRQKAMAFEVDDGYIFTQGKKYALALLSSPYGAMESANNALLVDYVDSLCQSTMEACPGVKIAFTGSPVIAVGNARQIKADSQWAISISVTLILLLLLFAFRRVKNLLLIGAAIVFGWLFAMGFIAVVRSDVSLIVLGIGSIIIGIAVNYPLHFIAHSSHGTTIREVLKEMVSPLLIGNVTTVGAFASLIPLDAPALRDLGLFAAFMLIGTILFVLVFLPHFVKKRVEETTEYLPFGKLAAFSMERKGWLMWVILIVTVVLGYFSLETSFDANMHHVNYMTPEQQHLLKELHVSGGINDTANVYIVTEGADWETALQHRRELAPLLDSLKQSEKLNSYSEVTAFICDSLEQQRRIQLWNTFWDRHRERVVSELTAQAGNYGFDAQAFQDFVDQVNADYTPQPFQHFEAVASVLFNQSFSTSTGNCSVVDVVNMEGHDLGALETALGERLGEKGYTFDFVGMNSAVARALTNDFNYIGIACGLIVFLFLWLSFGRLELSLLAFLPMAMGWFWILGIMYLCHMQFNIVNVILATFIFGQGDDYTIFMVDGLINEYAYRKKLLASYKNSIIISALIMFIGMGSLIVARHPALHSLAEVTIVGMFSVVLMAWVVPPFVFRWLVSTNNKIRRSPVTIEQFLRTAYCSVCYLMEICYGCLLGFVLRILPGNHENLFHRAIHRTMLSNVNHIWGISFRVRNVGGEDFRRGSILICNHQSILDPVYLLSLSPKILILVSGKNWKNPIVHLIFKLARFIPLEQPSDSLKQQISEAVADGYSVVIFPEGKRNEEKITRFHKGAFVIAQEINADILPVFLHGVGHVMPKGSGFASRGQVTVEVGARIAASQIAQYGDTHQAIAQAFHRRYQEHFSQLKKELEDTHYFHHYVISQYTYKGYRVEKETRRLLKRYHDFHEWIDHYQPEHPATTVHILHEGRGQFSLLFALVHPEYDIHAYFDDSDGAVLTASHAGLPSNLHVHLGHDGDETALAAGNEPIIHLSTIIDND